MDQQLIFSLLTKEYSFKLATTQEDFQVVKELRKEVFAPKYNMTPSILEKKGYLFSQDDLQSFLYILKHNSSDLPVGTVRLFYVNTKTPIQKLPMQKDGGVQDIDRFTQSLPIVEISRGALLQKLPVHHSLSALSLRTILTYGLMMATRINFFLYNYQMIFSIMEPSLHRILQRQNVHFEQVGTPVDYYGIRTPYGIERSKLLQETEKNMGSITRHYLRELCQNPESFWQFIDNNPYLDRSDIQLERICKLFDRYGENVDLTLLLGETSEPSTA